MRGGEYLSLRKLLLILVVLAALAAWACLPISKTTLRDSETAGEKPGILMEPVRLNAVGDVMLGRYVGYLISKNGFEYPLSQLAGEIADADISFVNLESPISLRGTPLPGKPENVVFRADPEAVACLSQAGFDVVSLANNHSVDYDSPALLDTIDLLNQVGISAVGGGRDIYQARQPVVFEQKGVKVAFLAYSDMADIYFDIKYQRAPRATEKRPGVAPLEMGLMLEDIAKARTLADRVVVSLHWGSEYRDTPTGEQREMAYKLIDGGADVIIGHHPHWFQGLEVYRGKLIAYSLGNFVMDQNWSDRTREGLFLQIIFERDQGVKARVRPVFIKNSQPQWVEGENQQRLLDRLVSLSAKLNTRAATAGEWVEYGN